MLISVYDVVKLLTNKTDGVFNVLNMAKNICDIINGDANVIRLHLRDDTSGYFEHMYLYHRIEGVDSNLKLYKRNGEKIGVFTSECSLHDWFIFMVNASENIKLTFRHQELTESDEILHQIEFHRNPVNSEITYEIFEQVRDDILVEISSGSVDTYQLFKKTDDTIECLGEESI